MAKSPNNSDSEDIMDAVEVTEPASSTTTKASSSTTASSDKSTTAAKSSDSAPKKASEETGVDDRNPVMVFMYNHPWISMFGFYLILGIFVKFWGWATIVFLAIPVFCFGRLWWLTKNTDKPVDQEWREKTAWWARIGLVSSSLGLASVVILDALGILQVFGQ